MFAQLVWLNIKARLQYGRSFIYEMMTSIMGYLFEFVAVWIIIYRFQTISGWTFFEIVFLHALGYFVRATSSAFLWGPMWSMSDYIQRGQLDRFFVAPVNTFLYLTGRHFMTYAISHIVLGGAVVIFSLFFLPIHWTLLKVLLFLGAVVGALLVYGSFIVFSGAISFWTVRSNYILRTLTDAWSLINYPLKIYPRLLQLLITFVIPLALLNYYPTIFLFDRENVGGEIMIAVFAAGCIMFGLAYTFWMRGAERYQGAGT
jgi:ABC-2 type transport system permease protein